MLFLPLSLNFSDLQYAISPFSQFLLRYYLCSSHHLFMLFQPLPRECEEGDVSLLYFSMSISKLLYLSFYRQLCRSPFILPRLFSLFRVVRIICSSGSGLSSIFSPYFSFLALINCSYRFFIFSSQTCIFYYISSCIILSYSSSLNFSDFYSLSRFCRYSWLDFNFQFYSRNLSLSIFRSSISSLYSLRMPLLSSFFLIAQVLYKFFSSMLSFLTAFLPRSKVLPSLKLDTSAQKVASSRSLPCFSSMVSLTFLV